MAKVIFISSPYENLGIEYMSSVLKNSGHSVYLIIDPCLFLNTYQKNKFLSKIFDYKSYIIEKVKKIQPDLICLSVMTDNYQWALDLAKRIKKNSSASIVFGGIHPTIIPETVINESCVDFVCLGEGEEAILELAERISNPGECLNIKNIWAKRDGQIFKNSIRPVIKDLDRLPFPSKELYYRENRAYSNEYFIMAGRGCDYACAFCCNHILLKLYGNEFLRRRSVGNVIKELCTAKKEYNYKFVWFMDDNFTSDSRWIKEFSREYSRYINVPFFCYSHPNDLTEETAAFLKEANCHEMGIGVESLNEDTCRAVNRVTGKTSIERSLKILRNNRIISITENILGLPGENEDDILNLVRFYNKNRPDLILFSWLKIFPGTSLLKILKDKGLITEAAIKKIITGEDNSLALGGNYVKVKSFRGSACLLALLPFLHEKIVEFLVRTKLFRCLIVLNPNLFLRIARAYKSSRFSKNLAGNKTYDAGLKISMRIYRYFITKKIKLVINWEE